jgi:DNA-binding transcriptional ArsR family regulator
MTIARRRTDFPLRETPQIRALRSPARQEIVDGLQALGPCSIADLGASLGRAPDSLYYHVRALERVGLVAARGSRRSGARDERLYDTPGRLVVDYQPRTAAERRALVQLTRSLLRIAERDLGRAIHEGRAKYSRSSSRNAWCARAKGWLTPRELAALCKHLEAAAQLLAHGRKRPGAALHSVAFALAPLAPSTRGRAPRTTPEKPR